MVKAADFPAAVDDEYSTVAVQSPGDSCDPATSSCPHWVVDALGVAWREAERLTPRWDIVKVHCASLSITPVANAFTSAAAAEASHPW